MQFNWSQAAQYNTIPSIIIACVLVIIGIIAGSIVEYLINRLFARLRVNDVLIATGAHEIVEKTGYRMDTAHLVGLFFKWFIIIVALDAAAATLGLSGAITLLVALLMAYLPHIVIAAVILFCGFVIAHRLERATALWAREAHIPHGERIASIVRSVTLTLTVLGIMVELHIAYEIALVLFGGIVFSAALAIGLAVGMGAKDTIDRRIRTNTEK